MQAVGRAVAKINSIILHRTQFFGQWSTEERKAAGAWQI